MEKRIICLAAGIMIFVFFPAHAFTLLNEGGSDRPGCDLGSFPVPGPNPGNSSTVFNACKNACGLDTNCVAWNFDARSGTGTCFLKNVICGAVISGSTEGGIKLPATMSEPEIQVERNGCDFSSFPATNPITHGVDDYICIRTCAEDNRCQAWNFDPRVGTGACFLKDCVPAPSVSGSSGVTSGVKFFQ